MNDAHEVEYDPCDHLRETLDVVQSQLREVSHEAEQAERLKIEFLAVMSHELRTPLHVILGFSELLLDISHEPLTDEQVAYVQRIFQSGKHLLGLVNSVIEVARLEAGDLTIVPRVFLLEDWFQQVISDIEPSINEKQLTLITKLDSRLPTYIVGDSRYLFNIAQALLANAVKYTDAGEVNIELRRTSSQSWLIEVADTGIGINDELKGSIFDLFRQGDGSYTRRHGGLGIGLSLVRKLTLLMGGQITFDSQVGVGSVFRVSLPLTEA